MARPSRYHPHTLDPAWHWTDDAACARQAFDGGVEFFPVDAGRGLTKVEVMDLKKTWCFPCPVRRACMRYALAAEERWGVWGGLDPDERAALRKRWALRRLRARERKAGPTEATDTRPDAEAAA